MGNIIEKSKKDLKRYGSRPVISDIVNPIGFIRYFAYRNTMPFIRDLLFFIFDTLQILIIFKYLGFGASSGGMLGYAFALFMSGFWNTLVYSMRSKVLELDKRGQLDLIPRYFSSMLISGMLVWLVFIVSSMLIFGRFGTNGFIIFSSRIISHGLDLYSTIYFFTIYTLIRVYIPFWFTVLNRALFLVVPIFLVKHLGVWAFVLSFFLERGIALYITTKYASRSIKIRGIGRICSFYPSLLIKDLFWFVKKDLGAFLKRAGSFSLMNLQKLIFLSLVSVHYRYYMLDFFLFYQLMHFFFLVPQRIAKSLYYDVTTLLHRGRYHFMKLLCNYNIVMSLALGAVVVFLFSSVFLRAFPPRFTSLMIELALIDKWNDIYMLIFFSFGILVIQRVFIVSEAHISYILSVAIFDYLILGWMVVSSPYFLKLGDPVLVFSLQGQLSIYYFLTLLIFYFSGIWKKESIIYVPNKVKNKGLEFDPFDSFLDSVRKDPGGIVVALHLSRYYSKRGRSYIMRDLCTELMVVRSSIRLSSNILLIYADRKEDVYEQELELVSRLGIYCDTVIYSDVNGFYEKLQKASSYEGFGYKGLGSLEFIEQELRDAKLPYSFYSMSYATAKRKKQIYGLLSMLKEGAAFVPENIVLKKDYLGLIPVIEFGKVTGFVELETKDVNFIKGLIKRLSLNEYYRLASKIRNG